MEKMKNGRYVERIIINGAAKEISAASKEELEAKLNAAVSQKEQA